MVVHCADSDAVARYLLTETAAKDLEVAALGLEEAFVALTGDDSRHASVADARSDR